MHGRDSPVKAKRPDGRSGRAAKQTQARAHLTSTFHDSRFSPDVKHESPQTPHADPDLDALLATVRDRFFELRAVGLLDEAEDAARTYRVLFARKLRTPAPATIPTPMPDRATWAAWRKRRLEELTGGLVIWPEMEVTRG